MGAMRNAGVLHRTDAVRLMVALRDRGATVDQIAGAINERFAPLLDRDVTRGMVGGRLRRLEPARALARKLQVQLLRRQDLTKAEALEQVSFPDSGVSGVLRAPDAGEWVA